MLRLATKAAILAAGVSSASAWASMVAREGSMEGAPAPAPAAGPAEGPGEALAPSVSMDPAPGPDVAFDPYAEPEFPVDHGPTHGTINHHDITYEPEAKKGNCLDYTWDDNGIMSYGPVPCPEEVGVDGTDFGSFIDIQPLLDAISDAHIQNCARVFGDAMIAGEAVTAATIDFPADSEEEACHAALDFIGATEDEGVCCEFIDTRRKLKAETYVISMFFNPAVVDEQTFMKYEAAFHGADLAVKVTTVEPQEELERLDIDPEAVQAFEEAVKNGEIMPMTTPPNVVGTPLTGCYEIDSAPPEGYIHAESNLEFDVQRGEHEGVKFEVESEKFTSLTCSEAPAHHFQESDYCKGTENCDETCRMIMPPKCNTTEASFGVCAPTVATICDDMDISRTTCTLASQKVLGATVSYNHLDVQNSPCVSSIHKVTADAHEAYRVAYDEWVFAYNNASHSCKIGTAIRDYNGMAFVQHHQNMENIRKVSEMVCDDEGFFDENGKPKPRTLLATETKQSETCSNIKQLIDEIKADTDLASKQIQCFASECMISKSLEAYKFKALQNKFFDYNQTLASYRTSVETFNNAVSDKFLKKAAAEEAFEAFHPLKADATAKFHKNLEVYMSFASGAAEGNCGLTDCEMSAVCAFEMQYKFSDYVTKSEKGCVRSDTPIAEVCYSKDEKEPR